MASTGRMRLVVTVAMVAVAAAVAGCATAPSGGPPRLAAGGSSQVQAYVQPLPPPGPTSARAWGPAAVVLGFLHASASYAFDPAAAKRYLLPALRKKWDPSAGPVAVVGPPTVSTLPYKAPIPRSAPAGQQLEIVKFTGQRLATLSQTGQYQYTPGQNVEYQFILANTDGGWRIEQLPQGQPGLLLTQSDFEAVYQARNLFFYAPPNPLQPAGVLVPDPVYAPLQSSNSALNTNLATGLVDGLLNGQGDWLSGATSSAFPAGSHLIGQVTITGRTAKVDLGGGAAHATDLEIQSMEAQLQATLGDRSYSAPLANQVQLYINHKLQYHQPTASAEVTPVASGPVFVVTGPSTVGQMAPSPRPKATPVPKLRPAQLGDLQITAIAAAPTYGRESQLAVAAQVGSGCVIYLNAGGPQYRTYPLASSGGPCTSLSWDAYGNVWAAAGHRIWVLRSQDRRPLAVDVTAITAVGQPGARIRTLRMAPDGVRAALLVHTSGGTRLVLTAVRFSNNGAAATFGQPVSIGAGGADPVAMSWSDPYHLAVLAGGSVLSVPLTGGAGLQPGVSPTSLGTAPANAETLTTNGSELIAGTADGHIFASSLATPGWYLVTTGSEPVYPG